MGQAILVQAQAARRPLCCHTALHTTLTSQAGMVVSFVVNVLLRTYLPFDSTTFDRARMTTPITAQNLNTSIIADINLIFDWLFYVDNKDDDLVKPEVIGALLVFTILGTFTWMNYATHGWGTVACCNPCMKCYAWNFEAPDHAPWFIQFWFVVLLEIVLNDVPMMILSIIVDTAKAGTFAAAGEMSTLGVLNVATSVFDILGKVAEAIDTHRAMNKAVAKPGVEV